MLLLPFVQCRLRQLALLWLVLAAALPGILASQTVIVRVTDAATKRPVAGAIVRLTDTTARASRAGWAGRPNLAVIAATTGETNCGHCHQSEERHA